MQKSSQEQEVTDERRLADFLWIFDSEDSWTVVFQKILTGTTGILVSNVEFNKHYRLTLK